jgi:type II secretory pathway component PulF
VKQRELPEMYVRMLTAGAASGDLAGVLVQFADYCEQRHSLSRRLRGMMTYPLIVLTVSLAVSVLLACFFQAMANNYMDALDYYTERGPWWMKMKGVILWLVPAVISLFWVFFLLIAFVPRVRRKWQWHLPGLRETCLAQLAGMMQLQLRGGIPLGEALGTVALLEKDTPVAQELGAWQAHLAGGGGGIPEQALSNGSIPPLFRWLVRQSGDDMGDGFAQTAKFYAERSAYRSETFLYAALPVAVLFLGVVILGQFFPVFTVLVKVMSWLGEPY